MLQQAFDPNWYQGLELNLSDIPTVLTALIFMIGSFIIYIFVKFSYRLGAQFMKRSQKPSSKNRIRPVHNKMRPIIQEMRELNKR